MVLAFDDPRGLALHCTVMNFSKVVSIPRYIFMQPYKSAIFIVLSLSCCSAFDQNALN